MRYALLVIFLGLANLFAGFAFAIADNVGMMTLLLADTLVLFFLAKEKKKGASR